MKGETGAMVLPLVDGPGMADKWRDARVPTGFLGYDGPSVVAQDRKTEQCPSGRHLWDLLEATGPYRYTDVDGCEGEQDVRLIGTCVRCGVIWRLQGTEVDKSLPGPGRVDPTPLRVGEWRAQEVDRNTWFGPRDEARSTYSLHQGDDPADLGWMAWGATVRGRRFYSARLDTWPVGDSVEAPTALACLRKVAKRGAV